MSNDSMQTLDKAHLQDPSQSSLMNTVPHNEGRMLEELYSNNNNRGNQPFVANHSDISYQNSDEDEPDVEAAYLNSGVGANNHHLGPGIMNQSGRLSSI